MKELFLGCAHAAFEFDQSLLWHERGQEAACAFLLSGAPPVGGYFWRWASPVLVYYVHTRFYGVLHLSAIWIIELSLRRLKFVKYFSGLSD